AWTTLEERLSTRSVACAETVPRPEAVVRKEKDPVGLEGTDPEATPVKFTVVIARWSDWTVPETSTVFPEFIGTTEKLLIWGAAGQSRASSLSRKRARPRCFLVALLGSPNQRFMRVPRTLRGKITGSLGPEPIPRHTENRKTETQLDRISNL